MAFLIKQWIDRIKKSETLRKHISCECKFKFDGKNVIQVNGGVTINVNVIVKHIIYVKKIMIGILVHVTVKDGKYLGSIMDDSAIICDEIIDFKETNFNEKNKTCKTQSFYISLPFLLITIEL